MAKKRVSRKQEKKLPTLKNNLEEKSVQDYVKSSIGYLQNNNYVSPAFNYSKSVSYFKSWIYTAASTNARACASVPLRLYQKQKSGSKNLFPTKKISRKKQMYLSGDDSIRPSYYVLKQMNGGDEWSEIIVDHPILDVLQSINPYANGFDTQYLKFLFLELTGNSYWYLDCDNNGIPQTIWTLPSQYVDILPGSGEALIGGYQYGYMGNDKTTFSPDEIIHTKYPNPSSLIYGLGKVEAGFSVVTINDANHKSREALLSNQCRPDYAVIFKDLDSSGASLQRYEQFLQNKLKGPSKSGRFLAMPANIELKPLNFTPKEMGQQDKPILDEICGVFGIPADLLLMSNATYANSSTASILYFRNTIAPILKMDEQKLNECLLPLYGIEEDAFLAYDTPLPEDQALEQTRTDVFLQRGVLTPNEVRRMNGIEGELENGDIPLTEISYVMQGKYSLGSTGLAEQEPEDTIEEPEGDPEPESEETTIEEPIQPVEEEKQLATQCKCCGKKDPKPKEITITQEQAAKIKDTIQSKENEDKEVNKNKDMETILSGEEKIEPEKNRLELFCEKEIDKPEEGDSLFNKMKKPIDKYLEAQKKVSLDYVFTLNHKSYTSDLDALYADLTKDLVKEMTEPMRKVWEKGGKEALSEINFSGNWDVYNQEVTKAIVKKILKLAGSVSDTTLINVKNLIKTGLESGNTVQEIADAISESTAFSPERSLAISRTETGDSYESGSIQAAKDSGVVEKQSWLLSVDSCELCRQTASVGAIGLDEKFPGCDFNNLRHVNCRCSRTFLIRGD
jgi:HK97 family phage portal protein